MLSLPRKVSETVGANQIRYRFLSDRLSMVCPPILGGCGHEGKARGKKQAALTEA
jgi:hypothetical protein